MIEVDQFGIRGALDESNLAAEELGVVQLLEEVVDQPSGAAGEDEGGDCCGGEVTEQAAPGAEKDGVVFAGFDR